MNKPNQGLLELPPSAKLVFAVLDKEGPLTQKQITKKSRLAQRTVRYGVKRLKEIDAITERPRDSSPCSSDDVTGLVSGVSPAASGD